MTTCSAGSPGSRARTNLVATGTHLLLDHPEALADLRADLSLIPNFIEEVLRHQGPVMMLFRRTTADVELSGVDPAPAWGDNPSLRGLHALPLRFVR